MYIWAITEKIALDYISVFCNIEAKSLKFRYLGNYDFIIEYNPVRPLESIRVIYGEFRQLSAKCVQIPFSGVFKVADHEYHA